MKRPYARRSAGPSLALAIVTLALLAAACAPRTQPSQPAIGDATPAGQLQRTAEIVYHRMAIGYLETGRYTTNVLVDVKLPEGAKWTLLAYPEDGSSYRLRVTSTQVPGVAWEVSPAGVSRVAGP